MNFLKYEGLGNDFIIIDCRELNIPIINKNSEHLIKQMCDRHFGIGSDGIITIMRSESDCFVKMGIFNSDGSEAEMCGNGIRCLIKFLYDNKEIQIDQIIRIETLAGEIIAYVNKNNLVNVNMGRPTFKPSEIPTTLTVGSYGIPEGKINLDDNEYRVCSVGMGNPHLIVLVDNHIRIKLNDWGHILEHSPYFPSKTNVHFVHIENHKRLNVLVWERGSGPTLACGTGACACLVATSKLGLSAKAADVSLPGGILSISWPSELSTINMLGPSSFVYSGQISQRYTKDFQSVE
tara:strand:- start:2641 stop:3516 length:876 start_codon:yes stop_codon:yes gene_type:complete